MAKQVGTFKIDGTIGDLTFYKSQGQHLVRQKGGVSGDRIKNDPNFARTRENNSEFGQAGTVGKGIRDAMRNMIDKAADSRVTSRLGSNCLPLSRAIRSTSGDSGRSPAAMSAY